MRKSSPGRPHLSAQYFFRMKMLSVHLFAPASALFASRFSASSRSGSFSAYCASSASARSFRARRARSSSPRDRVPIGSNSYPSLSRTSRPM